MDRIVVVILIIFFIYRQRKNENKISAEEAKEIMDRENPIILDVRTQEEYEDIRIEGSILIPDYDLKRMAETKLPDKDSKILLYCKTGSRSKRAARRLVKMGYRDVNDFGGIIYWPYKTIRGK